MVNFLFTCVGRRVALVTYFRKSLGEHGTGQVITSDISPLAAAARFGDRHYIVPRYTDENYVLSLLEICRKEHVQGLIPLMEPEFPVLACHRECFTATGAILVLSSQAVIDKCKDKYETYRFFCQKGIPTPKSFLPHDPALQGASFPLFVKPRSGMGSSATFKINNQKELEFFLQYVPDPIVQEYIEGTEYTMDILNDFEGRTIAVVPRERIEVRSGEVSKSLTVKDGELIEQTRVVAEALGGIGPLTIQAFKKENGEIIFTEINPRFGGGVPLAFAAGVNYPMLLSKMLAGEKVPPQLGRFQDGLYMLRYDEALYIDCLDNPKD